MEYRKLLFRRERRQSQPRLERLSEDPVLQYLTDPFVKHNKILLDGVKDHLRMTPRRLAGALGMEMDR